MNRMRIIEVVALGLGLLAAGCQGSVVGGGDARITPDPDHRVSDSGVVQDLPQPNVDAAILPDIQTDLPATAGAPCSFDKCASNLVCIKSKCQPKCTGKCGEKAPECQGDDGCHVITGGSAVCMPGTAQHQQPCGNGIWCVGGFLCVTVGGADKCLTVCETATCTSGYCGLAGNGCKICIE
jgi:hypothetical protein